MANFFTQTLWQPEWILFKNRSWKQNMCRQQGKEVMMSGSLQPFFEVFSFFFWRNRFSLDSNEPTRVLSAWKVTISYLLCQQNTFLVKNESFWCKNICKNHVTSLFTFIFLCVIRTLTLHLNFSIIIINFTIFKINTIKISSDFIIWYLFYQL